MGLKASRVGSVRLREVLASGVPARTRVFLGKVLESQGFSFSVIAPKKRFPTAAERNRARRRSREAFRKASVEIAPKVDLVVTVQPATLTIDFPTLVAEAAELLRCYSK